MIALHSAGASWSYEGSNGPARWPSISPKCGGKRQSPINIVLAKSHPLKADDFEFDALVETPDGASLKLRNTGHGAQIDIVGGDYVMRGGGLPAKQYKLAQFHWHWGSSKDRGSEHTIDGKRFAAECHFVFHDAKYRDLSAALPKEGAVAVVGIFLVVEDDENDAYTAVTDRLSAILNPGEEYQYEEPFKLRGFWPSNIDEFVRYKGSLTTPPCLETLDWTLMLKPISISQNQIAQFRKLVDDHGKELSNNFRPTQPLNGRVVSLRDD
ncbi:carbonic anhydrase 7-like isoform X2 [Ptychodera flava]|uniref:carbonic anhydrase 7-like isoform X2 n=1 Tax=Ptychodera flava TaxID=63121 RepID=UPI00396A16F2